MSIAVEEAGKLVCPIIKSDYPKSPLPTCKGDNCMVWRWDNPDYKSKGYCGIAGNPNPIIYL